MYLPEPCPQQSDLLDLGLCTLSCHVLSPFLQLYHFQTNKCLVAQGRPSQKGGLVVLKACDYGDPAQVSNPSQHVAA
jgi:hypothetical protein